MDNKMTALNEMELENVNGGFGLTACIISVVVCAICTGTGLGVVALNCKS